LRPSLLTVRVLVAPQSADGQGISWAPVC